MLRPPASARPPAEPASSSVAGPGQSDLQGRATALGGLVDLPALSAVAASFASVHGVGLAVLDGSGFAAAEVRIGSDALDRLAAASPNGPSGLRATQDALRAVPLG